MTYKLPSDPDAIVIQWRTLGGLAGWRSDILADLTIRADGSVTVGPRFNNGKTAESKLTTTEVQQLLSMAIDGNHFFSFDSTAVENLINAKVKERQSSIKSSGTMAIPIKPQYADAGTTQIFIAIDERELEIRYHGLFAAARDNPEIEALGKLRTIECTLLSLAEKISNSANE